MRSKRFLGRWESKTKPFPKIFSPQQIQMAAPFNQSRVNNSVHSSAPCYPCYVPTIFAFPSQARTPPLLIWKTKCIMTLKSNLQLLASHSRLSEKKSGKPAALSMKSSDRQGHPLNECLSTRVVPQGTTVWILGGGADLLKKAGKMFSIFTKKLVCFWFSFFFRKKCFILFQWFTCTCI